MARASRRLRRILRWGRIRAAYRGSPTLQGSGDRLGLDHDRVEDLLPLGKELGRGGRRCQDDDRQARALDIEDPEFFGVARSDIAVERTPTAERDPAF